MLRTSSPWVDSSLWLMGWTALRLRWRSTPPSSWEPRCPGELCPTLGGRVKTSGDQTGSVLLFISLDLFLIAGAESFSRPVTHQIVFSPAKPFPCSTTYPGLLFSASSSCLLDSARSNSVWKLWLFLDFPGLRVFQSLRGIILPPLLSLWQPSLREDLEDGAVTSAPGSTFLPPIPFS